MGIFYCRVTSIGSANIHIHRIYMNREVHATPVRQINKYSKTE